jgi:succinyl-CoA synthetase beta subunit
MPRLYEYQGKKLLEGAILVSPWEVVDSGNEAVATANRIGYPVMVKAQLFAGKRGKSGLIKCASNATEVLTAVVDLLGRSANGVAVQRVMITKRVEISKEMYVGIMIDPSKKQPVLIFSKDGGMEIENLATADKGRIGLLHVDVLRGLEDFQAREFLRKLDVKGSELVRLGTILARLFGIFRRFECKLLEINPLAKTPEGDYYAIDARVEIDDDAVGRHPELPFAMHEDVGVRPPTALELAANKIDENDFRGSAHFVQTDPSLEYLKSIKAIPIGFDGIGTGASLTQMDELVPLGYYPVNFCDTSGNPPASKLYRVTKIIFSQKEIEGYLLTCCVSSQLLENTARGIIKALMELYPQTNGQPSIPTVFMFMGAFAEEAVRELKLSGIDRSPWVSVLWGDCTAKQVALEFDRRYKAWRKSGGKASDSKSEDPFRPKEQSRKTTEMLEFATFSRGTVRIDLTKCRNCAEKPCLRVDEKYGGVLRVSGNVIALAKEREAIRGGACTECLACEFVCQREGKNAIKIEFATPELDEYLSKAN